MPIQDHFGSDSHAEAFRKVEAVFDAEPTVTYRKLRDMWLHAGFNRKESEALKSPWREFCLSSLEWNENRDLEALRLLDSASRLSPRWAWMRYYIAEILMRRLDMCGLAKDEIQGVVAACPWLWEARCLWTEILMSLGHPDPLKVVRSVAVPEQSRPAFLAWRGALKLWSGEYADAVEDLNIAAELQNPDALCWRGGALAMLGKLKESKADLDRLLAMDPRDPEGLAWRGEVNRRLGRLPQALKDLEDLIAISGDKPWAHVNRALIRLEKKDLAGAYEDFTRLYQDHRGPGAAAKPPFTAARLKKLLEAALKAARGCRRSDPHLNIAWMRAAGVPVPPQPASGSRLRYWAMAMKLPAGTQTGEYRSVPEDAVLAAIGSRR